MPDHRRTRQPAVDLIDFLPPPGSRQRWSARAKAAVVIAIRNSTLGLSDAYERYQLSPEELRLWEEAFDQDGLAGLRATALSSRVRSLR